MVQEHFRMQKALVAIALILWALAGLYFGMAGWVKVEADAVTEAAWKTPTGKPVEYKGVVFNSVEDLRAFQARSQAESSIFGWIIGLPAPLPVVISALGFSVLGSIFRVLWQCRATQRWPGPGDILLPQALGMLMSLLLLAVSYLLPAALTVDGQTLRPASLIFIALFAGAFADLVYTWVESVAKKLFGLVETPKQTGDEK
jgi:hypothetical protein